jgi:hypothetical protein
MGANNLADHEEDLSSYADDDLQEMEAVGSQDGVLNIVVQIDRKAQQGGPRRLYIRSGEALADDAIPKGHGSSGDPNVLADFLTWAKTKYQAERYMLVLWGHAYRLAFNRDPKDPQGLDFPILSAVLEETNGGKPIDIVAFDSCNVSLIEAAYQLRDVAKYMVASQFTDPLPGFPYDKIFARVLADRHNLAGDDRVDGSGAYRGGPEDFGRAIVSQFVRHYSGSKSVTMTMLDLSRADAIRDRIQEVACALGSAIGGNAEELNRVKLMFQRSQVPDELRGQPSIDLTTFCWHLSKYSGNQALRTAAYALGEDLLFVGDPPAHKDKDQRPFIVAHGRSGLVVAILNGVSVFAPNVATGFDSPDLRRRYESLDLSQHTLWDELVYALAEPE